MKTNETPVWHTNGLVVSTCSKEEKKAEQVYVCVRPDDHPIEIDAWVGYSSVGSMKLTRKQARELIGILLEALEHTT